MNTLVLGGTRFFGVHLVDSLLQSGHRVTIATRGLAQDPFGDRVSRLVVDRTEPESLKAALAKKHFDVAYDNLAYCANDVRHLLDHLSTSRYVMTSTCSVYDEALRPDIAEAQFDPAGHKLIWGDRDDRRYGEMKRQAECALFQAYPNANAAAMRIPFVIGPDDYTRRLHFYAEHIARGKPMWIDNLDARLSFISSQEAGRFMAWLGMQTVTGPINGSSGGTISLRAMTDYMQSRLGLPMRLDKNGEPAPYNGCPSFSLNTERAEAMGYAFLGLDAWIYPLLDKLIEAARPRHSPDVLYT